MTREEFETEVYSQLEKEALLQVYEAYHQQKETYQEKLQQNLEYVLGESKKRQEVLYAPVRCIQLSLMRYSILAGNPVIRIDVYGEGGIFTQPLVTKEMKVLWPAAGLEELREKLLLKLEDCDKIHEADVDVFLSKVVDMIEYMFRETLRYKRMLVEELSQLYEIDKLQDFYISVGEYMDTQEYMYVERGKVDIFFNEKNETLVFRTFQNAVYKDKKFLKLELDGARFIDCVFEQTQWKDCSLIDCTFENCSFKKTVVEGCDMRGCRFVNSTFYRVEYQGIDANAFSTRKGITCRPLTYDTCELKEVQFLNCDMSGARLVNVGVKRLEVDLQSQVEQSDLSAYVKKENKDAPI